MPTTRSALLCSSDARGGICRHVAELTRRVHASGWETRVAAPEGTLSRLSSFGLPDEVATTHLARPFPGLAALIWDAVQVRSLATRVGIIHCHGYRSGVSGVFSGRRPVVVTAHNQFPIRGSTLILAALRKADAVVAVSSAIAAELIAAGVSEQKVIVIPNGITMGPLTKDSQRLTIRHQLVSSLGETDMSQEKQAVLILGIGRLSPEKGFDILIQAFHVVRSHSPKAVLTIIGDGPQRRALEAAAGSYEQSGILFLGEAPDARSLIPAADLVVIPSLQEGQSRVALESLAAGVRVVAANVGGLPEMIIPGQTGWLSPPADPGSLALMMLEAINSEPDCYALRGRQWLAERFDEDRCWINVLAVYERLLYNRVT